MEIPNCRNKIDSHSGMIPSEVVQYSVVVLVTMLNIAEHFSTNLRGEHV